MLICSGSLSYKRSFALSRFGLLILSPSPTRRLAFWLRVTLFALLSATTVQAGNVNPTGAARLVQGVNASLRYQLYQPDPNSPPQKIDAAMAPVLGAIKNGLAAG